MIFDSHEIFSELPSLSDRPTAKKIWKTLERFLLPKMNRFYTVSEGYAQWFKEHYKIEPVVVRNVPKRQRFNEQDSYIFFPLPLNPQAKNVVLYQGAINMSRGLDHLIKAMKEVPNSQLWIAGDAISKKKNTNNLPAPWD